MIDRKELVERLTRPILGIENRTAQEVFDMMCDRFTRASEPGEAVAWQQRWFVGGVWLPWKPIEGSVSRLREDFEFNILNGTLELRPLYTTAPSHPNTGGEVKALRQALQSLLDHPTNVEVQSCARAALTSPAPVPDRDGHWEDDGKVYVGAPVPADMKGAVEVSDAEIKAFRTKYREIFPGSHPDRQTIIELLTAAKEVASAGSAAFRAAFASFASPSKDGGSDA